MRKHPQTLFGLRLRHARERAAMAQDRLGVLIGIDEGCSSARISRYETGTHAPPFEVAKKMAAVLNIPVAYLYCEDEGLAEMIVELSHLTKTDLAKIRKLIRQLRN